MQWDLKIKEDQSGLSERLEKRIWKTYFGVSTLDQITGSLTKPWPEVR